MTDLAKPTYLGDGVYAFYDAGLVKLMADRGLKTETIYLDDRVMSELFCFIEKTRNLKIPIEKAKGSE